MAAEETENKIKSWQGFGRMVNSSASFGGMEWTGQTVGSEYQSWGISHSALTLSHTPVTLGIFF